MFPSFFITSPPLFAKFNHPLFDEAKMDFYGNDKEGSRNKFTEIIKGMTPLEREEYPDIFFWRAYSYHPLLQLLSMEDFAFVAKHAKEGSFLKTAATIQFYLLYYILKVPQKSSELFNRVISKNKNEGNNANTVGIVGPNRRLFNFSVYNFFRPICRLLKRDSSENDILEPMNQFIDLLVRNPFKTIQLFLIEVLESEDPEIMKLAFWIKEQFNPKMAETINLFLNANIELDKNGYEILSRELEEQIAPIIHFYYKRWPLYRTDNPAFILALDN